MRKSCLQHLPTWFHRVPHGTFLFNCRNSAATVTSQWPTLLPGGPAKGRWLRGLLLLCASFPPSAAALGPECGTWFGFPPAGSEEEELGPAGNFPWMASLRGPHGSHVAFGAILSPRWIVTAASGVYDRSRLSALVGTPGRKVAIGTVVPHEAFDEITLAHDIALLETQAPIRFGETVRPVCFPYEAFPTAALENCMVVGSQHPHAGGGSLWALQVEDADPCPLHRTVTTDCCSHREGDSVPGCLGYPGNPVVCQAKGSGQWLLKGILTQGGARCYGPFLYTRVSDYSEWIVSTSARRGPPAAPIGGRRGSFPAQVPAEQHRKGAVAEPFPELEPAPAALDSSAEQPGLNWTQESGENSQELPEDPEGRAGPVYYDYYAGELLPAFAAPRRQLGGLCGVISGGLFLLGLARWVTD